MVKEQGKFYTLRTEFIIRNISWQLEELLPTMMHCGCSLVYPHTENQPL